VIAEHVHPLVGRLEKMWMPASEEEILAAIEAGYLIENATFDAKMALPDKGKSKDFAKDVAAMANNDVPYSTGLVRTNTVDQLFRSPLNSPVPVNVQTRSCGLPSPSLPASRCTRSLRMMILVLATS
jgi:hypothetical protein